MEQIAIMDYSIGQIFIYNLPGDIEDIEDYIDKLGHKPSDCNYMVSEYIIVNDETN